MSSGKTEESQLESLKDKEVSNVKHGQTFEKNTVLD